ncbi:hypothetical protein J3F84DRAFT_407837 [Trichoderma pleuroticola]
MSDLLYTTTSAFSARWDDEGSGATREGGFWHPVHQNDLRPIGSVGVPHYADINGYHLLWSSQDSGAGKDGAFWRPIPPNGYVALGDMATAGLNPPDTDEIRCMLRDAVKPDNFDSNSIWDSEESGAKSDVSIWEVLGGRYWRSESEGGITAIYLGAIRASDTYDAPDSSLAQVPLVWDFYSAQPVST